jgi:hypothetical protein
VSIKALDLAITDSVVGADEALQGTLQHSSVLEQLIFPDGDVDVDDDVEDEVRAAINTLDYRTI